MDQVPRVRDDAVPPRALGQPDGLHELRPPHGDGAAAALRGALRRRRLHRGARPRAHGRPAPLPRPEALPRPPSRRAEGHRRARGDAGGRGRDRAHPRRGGRAGLRLHGGLDGDACRKRGDRRGRARGGARPAAGALRGLGRRADAGGDPLAHADAAHHRGDPDAARGGAALRRRAHAPHHRGRDGLLRDAGRRADRRAGRAHLLRGAPRDRADHRREAPRGVPDGRVPAGAWDARPGDAPARSARRARSRSCGC